MFGVSVRNKTIACIRATVVGSHIVHGYESLLLNILGTVLNYQRESISTLDARWSSVAQPWY